MQTRRSLLRALGAGAAASVAGCTAPSAEQPADPGSDPDRLAAVQFRGDLRNRGYYPDATVPDAVTFDWALPVNPGDHSAAKASAVPGPYGDFVVSGDDGAVRRVTPDGDVRWIAETDSTGRGIHGTPVVANGRAYVGAYDGALYAFELGDGERLWKRSLGGSIGSSPKYHDGTVYVAVEHPTPDGSMAGVDALTGEVVWEAAPPTDHPHSTLAIDREAGRLVVGANDGILYGWSYPELDLEWRFETDGAIKGPIAVADGGAVFGSWDRTAYRVDVETGERDWAVETGGLVMTGPAIDPEAGVAYVGSHDGSLRALELASGEQRWRYDAGGRLIGSVAATSERVLAGSHDGHMHAVEADGGEGVWRADGRAGEVTSEALLVEDGVVFASRRSDDEPGKAVKYVTSEE